MLLSEAAAARIPEGCGIGDHQEGDDGCCGAPMALFTSHPNPKYFIFYLSHQIFRRMHGALNIGKKR
jgi:hypothetical protein